MTRLDSLIDFRPRRPSGIHAVAIFFLALAITFPSRGETPSASTPTPTRPERSRVGGTVAVAGTSRHLFGIPVLALDTTGGISVWTPSDVSVDGIASYLYGRTEAGLSLGHLTAGARVDLHKPYFHVGIGLALGYFWIHRVDGLAMDNLLATTELYLGPEVELGDHVVLALDAILQAELLPGTDPTMMWGPGAALRVRFY